MHALTVSIQQTVREFRSECSQWEDEFRSLFDDVDRFLMADGHAVAAPETASVARDVAGLKGLVEQQTEVLTALVNALTGQSAVVDSVSDRDQLAHTPSMREVDPFERLQRAVAAASEAS
ncbi:MAG: hypothetical protein ABI614_14440 [Planctomycetota bacterium]